MVNSRGKGRGAAREEVSGTVKLVEKIICSVEFKEIWLLSILDADGDSVAFEVEGGMELLSEWYEKKLTGSNMNVTSKPFSFDDDMSPTMIWVERCR